MDEVSAEEVKDPITRQFEEIENQCRPLVNSFLESDKIYRTLVDLSPDAVVIFQDGLYKFVNSMFSRQFGYTREDVIKGGGEFNKSFKIIAG